MLFEQYRMAINCDKYDIVVQNDDAIKRNQIWFDLLQWTFNFMHGLYLRNICIFIGAIKKDQFEEAECTRNWNAEQIIKNPKTKERNVHLSLLQKNLFCE